MKKYILERKIEDIPFDINEFKSSIEGICNYYDLTNHNDLDLFLERFDMFTEEEIKENLEECQQIINKFYNSNKQADLDYYVEGLVDKLRYDSEFEYNSDEIIECIKKFY